MTQLIAAQRFAALDPWVLAAPAPAAKKRLFCFSYAGGSASTYLPWADDIGADIQLCAIQLPGRGARFVEPLLSDWQSLLAPLAQAISKYSDLPFAFFGHSLGGMLAYELAQYCRSAGLALPEQLFVSATHCPRQRRAGPAFDSMPDLELLDRLRAYDGTPQELLDNAELMELLLPVFRADFSLLQNYRYSHSEPLDMPLTLFYGDQDLHLDPDALAGWQAETRGAFNQQVFSGGHFYINHCRSELTGLVRQALLAS